MIIRKRKGNPNLNGKRWMILGGFALGFIALLLLFSWEKKPNEQPSEFNCDAETLKDEGNGVFQFVGKNNNEFLSKSSL